MPSSSFAQLKVGYFPHFLVIVKPPNCVTINLIFSINFLPTCSVDAYSYLQDISDSNQRNDLFLFSTCNVHSIGNSDKPLPRPHSCWKWSHSCPLSTDKQFRAVKINIVKTSNNKEHLNKGPKLIFKLLYALRVLVHCHVCSPHTRVPIFPC